MSKDFAQRINELMTESGYQSYGTQHTPVKQAQWPDTSSQTPSTPNLTNVTNGETTPLGQPRSDMTSQDNGGADQEVIGEVASLLISIGFILKQAGVLQDKYDTQGVVDFLNGLVSDIGMENGAPEGADVEVDVVATPEGQPAPEAAPVAPVAASEVPPAQPAANKPPIEEKKNPYMESRQLLESRIKRIIKKK